MRRALGLTGVLLALAGCAGPTCLPPTTFTTDESTLDPVTFELTWATKVHTIPGHCFTHEDYVREYNSTTLSVPSIPGYGGGFRTSIYTGVH